MIKRILILICLLLQVGLAQAQKPGNTIQVNPGDDLDEIVRKSTLVVPTPQQYEWQKMEFIAFIHFGQNTFHAVEWGNGKEDPKDFAPSELDANQWISVINEAGMKMAMLTVKHHDGFCLWPTRTTDHSVKSSGWKNGKGDVLGELAEAAQKHDIKIGVYLSPADLHEIERDGGTYGNGSKPQMVRIPSDPELQRTAKQILDYELDDYNALFMNQLYEILTQYGPVAEVWFDGANPKPGTGQKYERNAWYDLIRKLQPEAVIAIKGPDVRWCGNEAGKTRKAEWSVLPVPVQPEDYDWPDKTSDDLGSRTKLTAARYLYWYPAETNTSIRNGWFYRDEEQTVKSVETLLDLWYRSVGGNTVLLLNLTPDRRGLIPEPDATRLRQLGRIISESFEINLAEGAPVSASESESAHEAGFAVDGKVSTFWKPNDGTETAELTIGFSGEKEFNTVVLQEAIRTQGQRIEAFAVDVWKDGTWQEVSRSTTVGYKSIRRFPTISSEKVRIRILGSRVAPTLSNVAVYKTVELLKDPEITRNREGLVSILSDVENAEIYYTTDGSVPDKTSALFKEPFDLSRGGEVKAIVYGAAGQSEVVSAGYDISPAKWQVVSVSSEKENRPAVHAIDANTGTIWESAATELKGLPPVIVIDFGEKLDLKGFTYLPDGSKENGICQNFRLELSVDGKNWQTAKTGTFDNIRNNPVLQEIRFEKNFPARYLRFSCEKSLGDGKYFAAAEIGVITARN